MFPVQSSLRGPVTDNGAVSDENVNPAAALDVSLPAVPNRDEARAALPPFDVWRYIIFFSCKLNSLQFRLMRFKGNPMTVNNNSGTPRGS